MRFFSFFSPLQWLSILDHRVHAISRSMVLRDPVNGMFLLASALMNIAAWVLVFYGFSKFFSNIIPIHYNIYFGADYIDFGYKVIYIPFFGLLVMALNIFLIYIFYFKEKILSYVLSCTVFLVQFFLLISVYFLAQINSVL